MSICTANHSDNPMLKNLPIDQGGAGRHKCAGCAFDRGYQAGLSRIENINIDFDSLPDSQASEVRHRSPHAAFAMGYQDGVAESYRR